jgi:hypothetical protein
VIGGSRPGLVTASGRRREELVSFRKEHRRDVERCDVNISQREGCASFRLASWVMTHLNECWNNRKV